jgi:hypothetical protein
MRKIVNILVLLFAANPFVAKYNKVPSLLKLPKLYLHIQLGIFIMLLYVNVLPPLLLYKISKLNKLTPNLKKISRKLSLL